jgi:hypothetical protein
MSNQTAEAKVVASKFEELAEALGADIEDVNVEVQQDFGTKTLHGKAMKEAMEEDATEGGDEEESVTEGDDEQTPTESEDITEGDDDDEDTIGDGEVACQCGAVFDSKQSLYGHSSHCDEYESVTEGDDEESSTEGGEEQESTIEDGENDTISDSELVEMGVKESNIEDVRKYRSKNGVCSEENCPYGANDGEEFCASHQGSSSSKSKTSKKSSSKKTKKVSDLTEGQMAMVQNLIEDEGKSLEEAVSMV